MLKILLGIVFILGCGMCIFHYYKLEKNKKELFTENEVITLEKVMIFSLIEFTSRLKRYYGRKGKTILVEYADGKYVAIDTKGTQLSMINKLDEVQNFMISKRYNPDDNYVVKDSINKIMYDIWLDYAYKGNYRSLFWREMNTMLEDNKISKYSYNEIYRRFTKYEIPQED